jgi:hypothetical protein
MNEPKWRSYSDYRDKDQLVYRFGDWEVLRSSESLRRGDARYFWYIQNIERWFPASYPSLAAAMRHVEKLVFDVPLRIVDLEEL